MEGAQVTEAASLRAAGRAPICVVWEGLEEAYLISPPPPPAAAACRRCLPPPPAANMRLPKLPYLQDKAHKLGDILVRQEVQTKDLQRQLATLQEAQAAALAAATAVDGAQLSDGDLSAMRQQLLLAQAQLQQQSVELEGVKTDYDQRQLLLQGAAGAPLSASLRRACLCARARACNAAARAAHSSASQPGPPCPAMCRCCPAGGAGAAGRQPAASGGGGPAAAAE